MPKRYHPLTVGGEEFRLRLTMAGQRSLRERWGEDILSFLLAAATDTEKLCALLGECLRWAGEDNRNSVTDGEALYDLLVDNGWQGQERFARLVFDLGEASGLLTKEQAGQLTTAVGNVYAMAFGALG